MRAATLTQGVAPLPAPVLNDEQQAAVAAIDAAEGFVPHLLHGVTGSGKTEVYLEAAARRLARDARAQVLLLVPEINLTPQLESRLRARFPQLPVAVLHSGLAAGERSAQWLAAHEGRARLVLGTRLAVFASLPHLALVVVDEEHDASFKASDGPRCSARDLAVKRAQLAGVPVVLGSATPAIETWAHAQRGKYRLLTLGHRAGGGRAADVQVRMVDTRSDKPEQGLTASVRSALVNTLAAGGQSLVFINRRGYAPVLACESCGWLSQCSRCSTYAAFHKGDGSLRCHHCGWQVRVPSACPTCGNVDLRAVGQGTQRIEETLGTLLPGARIARLDRDSTRRKDAARDALEAMHAGAVDVLVGTQMIAKGHDFQRVSLVVVLNADAQLVAADFRAPERLFATLLQVAGRAGRAGHASRVLVQTRYPAHPLLQALARADYAGFRTGCRQWPCWRAPGGRRSAGRSRSTHSRSEDGIRRVRRVLTTCSPQSQGEPHEPEPDPPACPGRPGGAVCRRRRRADGLRRLRRRAVAGPRRRWRVRQCCRHDALHLRPRHRRQRQERVQRTVRGQLAAAAGRRRRPRQRRLERDHARRRTAPMGLQGQAAVRLGQGQQARRPHRRRLQQRMAAGAALTPAEAAP